MRQLANYSVLTALSLTAASAAAQSSFSALEADSSHFGAATNPQGVSTDGRFIVGMIGLQASLWVDGVPFPLPFLHPESAGQSEAFGVDAQGTTVVGKCSVPGGLNPAAVWSSPPGGLPSALLGELADSQAKGVSADGAAMAGTVAGGDDVLAFYWSNASGIELLGDLPGGQFKSLATGISGDGTCVVGGATVEGNRRTAFRWTRAQGMVALGPFPGGDVESTALATSFDGSVIVGYARFSYPDCNAAPFTWSEADGYRSLGSLDQSGKVCGVANSVDALGRRVVGHSISPRGVEAFLWTPESGMRSLRDVLAIDYGLDLRGWCLVEAMAISADGTTIVGRGTDREGNTNTGWVARLDGLPTGPFCLADFYRSGFVDTDDFDAFVHAFEQGDRTADFDGSCFVDTDDFDAFIHAFEVGC